MTIEIKVPQLPESVTDATLVSWHKKPGDTVSRDENLVDLETDKVVLEVPAPASGILAEIKVEDGATVIAGDLLALLEEGEPVAAAAPVAEASAEASVEATAEPASRAKLSPAVRRLLDEHDLDATIVIGSGKDGRITKSDVMDYLKSHDDENVTPGDPAPELEAGEISAEPSRSEQRVPMTRLRARIAERMVEAQHTAAMLTTFNEVDLTKVMSLRKRYKESFEKEHGVRLGYMSFFAKAAVEALKKFPAVNASIEGNDVIYHDYVDIGVAVSSERGLMVPVLRNVDHMNFAQVESGINDYAAKVREGSIGMDDLTGGTFTITNGGIFGSMLSTPILNPPQSAILGMHNIQERAMVVDGEIVVRPMMYLALTYDHRIIDGREAVQFLVSIKNSLEDPGRLLLQV
ncbi:MAG: 2-oxoglutarate dehydrogenase complex dihydrolipoyllysine-residue succinyltransferase [Gammaproteobacteria bacterium]|nr:2-oxoglutarate dehydrogenase complex dihydrolipoyllysine-residue succinyltransferase [Gammaproteobacteria bacterium]